MDSKERIRQLKETKKEALKLKEESADQNELLELLAVQKSSFSTLLDLHSLFQKDLKENYDIDLSRCVKVELEKEFKENEKVENEKVENEKVENEKKGLQKSCSNKKLLKTKENSSTPQLALEKLIEANNLKLLTPDFPAVAAFTQPLQDTSNNHAPITPKLNLNYENQLFKQLTPCKTPAISKLLDKALNEEKISEDEEEDHDEEDDEEEGFEIFSRRLNEHLIKENDDEGRDNTLTLFEKQNRRRSIELDSDLSTSVVVDDEKEGSYLCHPSTPRRRFYEELEACPSPYE